jgi:hypothetical protein
VSDTLQAQVEKLVDGAEIEVSRQNGAGIVKESILIRKIPIRKLGQMGQVYGQEPLEVSLYTDKDEAWMESLTDDSFEAVLQEGRRLNRPSFDRWLQRQRENVKLMVAAGIIKEPAGL